ncbi:hypothetical protein Poli38472_011733 [Pythium oligandrum]|uniref:C2 DOCK-type domain-containing protein n=1 Tax=Pythium oligandrum TaxID=41045 RepID=A0A8K1C8C5_PYTOL|nr:hypothetical protein Poli38472_011733 [Pythium oligandrum]|eukprot:TMW58145.1 hypothetical protein Poli38472_011733 [Pythium oligandrum]
MDGGRVGEEERLRHEAQRRVKGDDSDPADVQDDHGQLKSVRGENGGSPRPNQLQIDTDVTDARQNDDDCANDDEEGFGIEPGTLEVIEMSQREWIHPVKPPIPVSSPAQAPILQEFGRVWKALRLRTVSSVDGLLKKKELDPEQCLLKNYDPRFPISEATFPSEIEIPGFLQPRIAAEEALAFLVRPCLQFTLGIVEPLYCRLVIYDTYLSCRVTEEFVFVLPPSSSVTSSRNSIVPSSQVKCPYALFYILPNHIPQNLHLVLKVSKVLVGEGDTATAPYCFPDKFVSETERQKLHERNTDCIRRLGRYLQPVAWGTVCLTEGANKSMTMYRQRVTMSDEQRLAVLSDAIRGTLKERVVPSACEISVEKIESQRFEDSKFRLKVLRTLGKDAHKMPSWPILEIYDPSSVKVAEEETPNQQQDIPEGADAAASESAFIQCREIQPLAHPSSMESFGLHGGGPVGLFYVNTLYLYPMHVDKLQFRNIAVRIQLLQKEVEYVCGVDSTESKSAVVDAVYSPTYELASCAYTQVNYHQRNPQFETEMKICLPEQLSLKHHIMFTFYHVHCKKLQPKQPQQELVGYAVLPILRCDGALIQDNNYTVEVMLPPPASKNSTSGGVISLPPGYVDAARNNSAEGVRTTFTCRTRALSSVRSQDSAVAKILEPFQSISLRPHDSISEAQVIQNLIELDLADKPSIRHFFLPVVRFILAYLRFGSSAVREVAFKILLGVLEKSKLIPQRSSRPHEVDPILYQFVSLVYDEQMIESLAAWVPKAKTDPSKAEKKPQSVLHGLVTEWTKLLVNGSKAEESIAIQKLSLENANILLPLILKSMAMQRCTKSNVALPTPSTRHDEDALLEDLLMELIRNTTITSKERGLTLRKTVNQSVANFCRGMFLISTSILPVRVINYFLGWTQQYSNDVTVHILFPFLNILMDFEFFAVVNAFKSPAVTTPRRRRGAWLARLIFLRLLKAVDEEKEDNNRSTALQLLRRMFVMQVYHPQHQSTEHQELIALMYFPMISNVARFTTDGKLLATSDSFDPAEKGENEKMIEFRRELLICVAHLLSSVSLPYLTWYFRQNSPSAVEPTGKETNPPLSPTAALLHYRKLVEETKAKARETRRQSVIQRTVQKVLETVDASDRSSTFDEIRVHACLSLVRQMIENFLVDESALSSLQHLLAPDLLSRNGGKGLLDIEMNHKHRRSRHRGTSLGQEAMLMHRTSFNAGNRSPNAKMHSGSGSFSSRASGAPPRLTSQKSQRNWGKAHASIHRQPSVSGSGDTKTTHSSYSISQRGDEEEGIDYETNVRNLHCIISETALRALRTAVDQFEWILRFIEKPLDYRTNMTKDEGKITVDEAFSLLGSLVDIFFLLLKRASAIDCLCTSPEAEIEGVDELNDDDAGCFLAELFRHLHCFLKRFEKALFATRISGLPLIHDQSRIILLVGMSATAKMASVRQLAAALLCRLILVCYEQTGSFLLIKRALLKGFCANFFSPSVVQIPTECLREAVELWRQYAFPEDQVTRGFELQLIEFLNSLNSQIKVFEMWIGAMTNPDEVCDIEEVEDGIYRVVQGVSPHWLLDVKMQWMEALLQLHASRKRYAEAACCRLEIIAFAEELSAEEWNPGPEWLIHELRSASDLAEKASWHQRMIDIDERLLTALRAYKRFTEYQATLKHLDVLTTQFLGNTGGDLGPTASAFYRVSYAGDCVPASVAKNEYVYKRSKFVSLGEFVGDMKASLRSRYPLCERVDVLPESKPFPAFDGHPNVIFMRITSLEIVSPNKQQPLDGSTFRFSTPYTLGNTSYGKTAEQMKRVTYLSTAHSFPCSTTRQIVCSKQEELRCPIDNSMDDIRKRCGLLQDEIDKEARGRTDLKTLTLVLKGSVDTHVHGGIPEVIDAFLARKQEAFPPLLGTDGNSLEEEHAMEKRLEMAELLVRFLGFCWTCLLISRAAHRRSAASTPTHSSASFFASETHLVNPSTSSITSSPAKAPGSSPGPAPLLVTVLTNASVTLQEDDAHISALQIEFEKSFLVLIEGMISKVAFSFPHEQDLRVLLSQTQRLRSNSIRPTSAGPSSGSSSMILPPGSAVMPPPAPMALPGTPTGRQSATSSFHSK